MPSFKDTFNRPGPQFGNGWYRTTKLDSEVTQTFTPFVIANNRAEAPAVPRYIYYRDRPVPVNGVYEVIFTMSHERENAELIVRFTSTLGRNRARLSVVVHNTEAYLAYREGDAGLPGAAQFVETIIGSWTRLGDGLDYTIRVTIQKDDFKIYDSSTATPNEPVLEVTQVEPVSATGIGLGNGYCDTFQINDFSGASVLPLSLDPVSAHFTAQLDLRVQIGNPVDYPDAQQRFSTVVVDPYLAVSGIPEAAPSYAAKQTTSVSLRPETYSALSGPPDLYTTDTGLQVRWIPTSTVFGLGLWTPSVNTTARDYKLALTRKDGSQQVEGELARYPYFSYSSSYGPLEREAISFAGDGYLQLVGATGTTAGLTVAIVVIPRATGYSYSILSQDDSDPAKGLWDKPLTITKKNNGYRACDLGNSNVPRADYRTTPRFGKPVLVMMSMDPTAGVASLLVHDQRRFHRRFKVDKRFPGVNTMTPAFFVGSALSTVGEYDMRTTMRGQVLEIGLSENVLSDDDELDVANKYCALYGIGL